MDQTLALVYQFGAIGLMLFIMYFVAIRPQKKKDQAITTMRNSLEVGDYVTTIGGIIGRVVSIRDDKITLETGADRVKIHITKWAIQTKNTEE